MAKGLSRIPNGHKIVVFSQFLVFLKALKLFLTHHEIKHSYFDGSTENREAVIDEFNHNKNNHVLLASIKAGGTGINLSKADVCFIAVPW